MCINALEISQLNSLSLVDIDTLLQFPGYSASQGAELVARRPKQDRYDP